MEQWLLELSEQYGISYWSLKDAIDFLEAYHKFNKDATESQLLDLLYGYDIKLEKEQSIELYQAWKQNSD